VVMARVHAPDLRKSLGAEKIAKISASLPEKPRKQFNQFIDLFTYDIPFDLDGWDGYTAARERMYASIMASNSNAVIVSGDSHAFWTNELHDKTGARVAAEFGVSSVTSPGLGEFLPGLDTNSVFTEQNKEVLFTDQSAHGYTLVTVTKDSVVGEHIAVGKLTKPYQSGTLASFQVSPSEGPGIGDIQKI
jgi:alkaline phosphatase D